MEKCIIGILLAALLITVCACSADASSSRVENAVTLIAPLENITITPNHQYQVMQAERVYNSLTEEEKQAVTNYETLQNALALMDEFNVTAKDINKQISNLPADLLPEDFSKLTAIQEQYMALSEEGRKLVTEYSKLDTLLKDYERWYSAYSPYAQLKAYQDDGKHGRVVMEVVSEFSDVIPTAFRYGYSLLICRSLTVYTQQLLDEGEYSHLLTVTNSEKLRQLDQRCSGDYRTLLGEAYLIVAQQYCDQPNADEIRYLYNQANAADISQAQLVSIRYMWSEALEKEAKIYYSKGQYEAVIALYTTNEIHKSFSFSPEFRNITAKSYIAEAKKQANKKQYFEAIHKTMIAQALALDFTIQEEARQTASDIEAKARPNNGTVLSRSIGTGNCEIVVESSNLDACVKVESVTAPSQYVLVFVQKNSCATIKLPSAAYTLKYVTGYNFLDMDRYFLSENQYFLVQDPISFISYTTPRNSITVPLYSTNSGDVKMIRITSNDF